MGFSIWLEIEKYDDINTLKSGNSTLNENVNSLLEKRGIDSTSNATFQKYLKDTFGIERTGNKPIIYNTKIYNSNIHESEGVANSSTNSINYGYELSSTKDILTLYPKTGVWIKPFFSFDASLEKINKNIYESDGEGKPYSTESGPSEITLINNKKYRTISVFMSLVRSKSYPLIIDISGDKSQYIVFGDDADPNKRYMYKNGKVNWIPKSN